MMWLFGFSCGFIVGAGYVLVMQWLGKAGNQ